MPLGEQVRLDGSLSQPLWQQAPVFDAFVERSPRYGVTPEHRTQVRVLYDERAMYVGIKAFDPTADQIRAPLVRHDTVYLSQDFVALYLDPAGQRKSAQFFRINASGSTGDGLYTNDDRQDFSPDFNFDSASHRDADGYSVVLRVPFSSLRYAKNGKDSWRMMIVRNVPREQFHKITSVPVPLDASSFIDVLQPVEGVDPPDSTGLELRPNLTYQQTSHRTSLDSDSVDREWNLGLDFKWQANSEWVIDGTLNPDFSQIQLDTPQLAGNTQFALFFPENRPFFLESADLLRSPGDAIYTRTITRPQWGLRTTMRTDHGAGTAFTLRDEGRGRVLIPGAFETRRAVQPASNVTVARMQHDSQDLSVAGLASNRRYTDDIGSNTVVGADATWQATRAVRLTGQWLASDTSAHRTPVGRLARGQARRGNSVYLALQRRTEISETDLAYQDISGDFRNDNGFLWQSDIRRWTGEQSWISRNVGPFNDLTVSLSGEQTTTRSGHERVSESVVPAISMTAARNSYASIQYRGWSRLRVESGSQLLDENYWHADFSVSPSERVSLLGLGLDAGDLADTYSNVVRPGHRATADVAIRPFDRLEVEGQASTAALRGEGGRVYDETAAQVMGIWHFSPMQTLRLILQSTRFERQLDDGAVVGDDRQDVASVTYAMRKSAGTVFYLGASRTRQEDRLLSPLGVGVDTELFAKLQIALDR